MNALRENSGVTLILSWNGGDDIVIPAGKAKKPENGRAYYTLEYLAELYGERTASPENSGIAAVPDIKANPQTGR